MEEDNEKQRDPKYIEAMRVKYKQIEKREDLEEKYRILNSDRVCTSASIDSHVDDKYIVTDDEFTERYMLPLDYLIAKETCLWTEEEKRKFRDGIIAAECLTTKCKKGHKVHPNIFLRKVIYKSMFQDHNSDEYKSVKTNRGLWDALLDRTIKGQINLEQLVEIMPISMLNCYNF